MGRAQCENERIMKLFSVLDVRELVQLNDVQGLAPDRIWIVRQSLYHRPVPKREPPFSRRTLKYLPSEPRQESGDLVDHLDALPLSRSNNLPSETFFRQSV